MLLVTCADLILSRCWRIFNFLPPTCRRSYQLAKMPFFGWITWRKLGKHISSTSCNLRILRNFKTCQVKTLIKTLNSYINMLKPGDSKQLVSIDGPPQSLLQLRWQKSAWQLFSEEHCPMGRRLGLASGALWEKTWESQDIKLWSIYGFCVLWPGHHS